MGPGELVVRRGDEGDYFYLIEEGTIAVYVDRNESFGLIEDGEDEDNILDLTTSRKGGTQISQDVKQPEHSLLSFKLSIEMRDSVYRAKRMSAQSGFCVSAGVSGVLMPLDEEAELCDEGEEVVLNLENDRRVRDLVRGDTFGELALLYSCPRTAHCITQTPCTLWRVRGKVFWRCMEESTRDPAEVYGPRWKHSDLGRVLRSVQAFAELDDHTLYKISQCMTKFTVKKGDTIIRKGEVGRTFYVIKEGKVKFHDIGLGYSQQTDHIVGRGEFFGEKALMTGDRRAANVTAVSDKVELLAMGKEKFEEHFGPLQDLINRNLLKKKLVSLNFMEHDLLQPVACDKMRKDRLFGFYSTRATVAKIADFPPPSLTLCFALFNKRLSVPNFANAQLAPHEIEDLLNRSETVDLLAGDVIAQRGEWMQQLIAFIQSGKIHVTDEKKGAISILKGGSYFGAMTLDFTGPAEDYRHNSHIEVVEDALVYVITRENIEQAIGSLLRLGKPMPYKPSRLDHKMCLEDLELHRILGAGSYGRVWLAQHKKQPERIFALKVMDKVEIASRKMPTKVIQEKNILASIDHPPIVTLIAAFQDKRSLYMAQEFLQGGELFTLLSRRKKRFVSNDAAIFYSAAHLHQRNIVYRDLKPENVVLDHKGYCVMVDLGFAKVVVGKTFTSCGSPEYMAPEVILGKGACWF